MDGCGRTHAAGLAVRIALTMIRVLRWILREVWEKVNLPAMYRELKALGKKHGRRFFWVALIWELIEDVVFPGLAWLAGVPGLIPLFLVLHFEPIVYPAFFWGFRMWDRFRGREPWEPHRPAHSNYWRSAIKVVTYKVAIAGWFVAIMLQQRLSPYVIAFYIGLTTAFGFVHERIWHDSNYGIDASDRVMMRRNLAKTTTYRIVSVMTMYPLLRVVATDGMPWRALLLCQALGLAIYFGFEIMWAHSGWGVAATVKETAE
jgi:hypothetical protein